MAPAARSTRAAMSDRLSASAQTKNQSAAEVAELLMGEVSRLSTEPVPDIEMTPRKAVVVGNFARNLETAAGLVAQVGPGALWHQLRRDQSLHRQRAGDYRAATCNALPARGSTQRQPALSLSETRKSFCRSCGSKYPQVEVIPVAELDLNTALLRKKQQTD